MCRAVSSIGELSGTWLSWEWGRSLEVEHVQLKFLLNASIDTLPTAANLHKWKKSTSDKCKLSKARETTCHILNNCTVSLLNGKYLWRHNNIEIAMFIFIRGYEARLSKITNTYILYRNLIRLYVCASLEFNFWQGNYPILNTLNQS